MKKKISFNNSKGDKLVGILTEPEDAKNKPLVIIVHGFTSHKNSPVLVGLANALSNDGIATLRIDLYAHGESEGVFEDITVSEAVDDILQAIKYGKSLGYTKIGLVGSSFGGISSTMAASKTHNLLFLGLKSPVSDYEAVWKLRMTQAEIEDWKKSGITDYEGRILKYTFFDDLQHNHPYKIARTINAPTLIIHGDRDEIVPLEQSEKLAKLISQAALYIVKDANHRYEGDGQKEEFIETMHQFVLKHV